jgi:hypothetical protein
LILALALVVGLLSTDPSGAIAGENLASGASFSVGVGTASADFDTQLCLGGYGSFCNRPSQGIKDPLTTGALAVMGTRSSS